MGYLILLCVLAACIGVFCLITISFIYATAWAVLVTGVLLVLGAFTYRKEAYTIQEYFIPPNEQLREKLFQAVQKAKQRGLRVTWRESSSTPEESFWVGFRASDEQVLRHRLEEIFYRYEVPIRLGEKIASHDHRLYWGLIRFEKDP